LLGLALTAGGLSILRSRQEFPDLPRPLIVALADFNFGNSEAFIVGGLLALLGIILVAGGRPGYPPEPVNAWRLPLLRYQPDKLGWAILGLTMIGNGILYSSLASKHYSHWDILLFGGGLLLTTLAVRRLVRPAEPPRPLPLTRLDLAVAVGLALGTFAVNSVDLTRWNFAWVGDEGSFFNAAHDALRAGSNWPWNFFDLLVLYNQFPMLDTLYQGLGLRIFGADIVGWRLTEVLVTAMTSVLLYWQVTVLLGRLPAIAAAVTVAASHYLMAFARIGYNNTHMIFYAALTFLLLTLTVYTRRPGFLFTTGVAMGFCLYTIQGAYLVWPTVASLLLIGWIRRPTWRYVFPVGLLAGGFVLVVLPAVLNTPIDRLLQALTFQTRRENPTMDAAHVLHTNVAGSFVALWDNYQAANHYVSGPLVDFITGLLLLLGLAIALTRLRQGAAQLALAWFGFGIVLLPISTYMLGVPLTRLLYVIPAVALLVGIAVGALEQILVAHLRIPARGSQALVLALLALIPILNLQQLLVISPSQLDVNDQIMFMKEIQEHPAQVVVEVGLRPEVSGNLTQMLSWYPWLQGRYRYIGVADLPAGGLPETGPARTIYLVDQQNVKLGLGRVVAAKLPPGYQRVADRSPRGNYEVQLFIAAADHASPANERAAVPQAHH
jgi:4-amino-4-deoxy-L-arabinose transferase-like glycosyltransferase